MIHMNKVKTAEHTPMSKPEENSKAPASTDLRLDRSSLMGQRGVFSRNATNYFKSHRRKILTKLFITCQKQTGYYHIKCRHTPLAFTKFCFGRRGSLSGLRRLGHGNYFSLPSCCQLWPWK